MISRTLRIPAMFLVPLLAALPACRSSSPGPASGSFEFASMGTVAACSLELPPGLDASRAEALVQAVYDSLESELSIRRPDSAISRLNRAPADSAVAVSPWLGRCLELSRQLGEQSGGAFDPTAGALLDLWGFHRKRGVLPGAAAVDSARALLGRWRFVQEGRAVVKESGGTRFDLGGIAKGLAVDLAVARLRAAGVKGGLIDLGGNLFCLGGAPGRADWRVGIKDPLDKTRIFATVTVSNAAVATSGSYEKFVTIDGVRYGHIMNPATGSPAAGTLSATVIAPTGILADGLSTTLFILGPEQGALLLARHHPGVEAVFVVPGPGPGEIDVIPTPGLAGRIAVLPGYADRYRLRTGAGS
ncbi:MAG: FAD:protein FMN transferase [Candidatus Krumholzibacteriia bacterium]